mgnify:FL=1
MKKISLVLLVGGKGTRIKSITKKTPKPLIKFNKFIFLDYLITNLCKFNLDRIYLMIGYKRHLFKKYNNRTINFVKIKCIYENKPMGTAGALYSLKKLIKKDFIVCNGDSIFDVDLAHFTKTKITNKLIKITLVKNLNYKSNKKLASINTHKKIIYFKKGSKYMNGGIYLFAKQIFKFINNKPSSLEENIIPYLIRRKKVVGNKYNNFFIDIGTPTNLLKAKKSIPKYFFRPAIFLDRDGVINYDKGYTHKISQFKFRPKVLKALRYLNKKKYYIFIVTNQAGIAKGKFKKEQFYRLHNYIKQHLIKNNAYINDVEFCPFHPNAIIKKYRKKSNYRKPGNLMIKSLFNKWPVIKKKSFMIGNEKSDEIAALKSNIKFEYVKKNIYLQVKKITSNY